MIRLPRVGPQPSDPSRRRRIALWALALLVAGFALLDAWSRRGLLLELATVEGGEPALRLERLLMPLQPQGVNASDALSAAGALARLAPDSKVPLPSPDEMPLDDLTPRVPEALREILEIPENRMALEVLDRASGLTYLRYLEASADAPGLTILQRRHVFERISTFRLARLLRLRAMSRVAAGNPEAAYEDVAALLRLGRWIYDELPVLFSSLLSVHMTSQGLDCWEQLATHTALPPSLAPELSSALIRHREISARGGLEGERAFVYQMMRRTGELMLATGGTFESSDLMMRLFGGWFLRAQTTEHLKVYNALVTWSQAPPYGRQPLRSLYRPRWPFDIPIDLLLPNLEDAVKKNDRLGARLELARVALAYGAYSCREGSLPESLEQLVPEDLAALPLDPWSGEPVALVETTEGAELRAGPSETAVTWRLRGAFLGCPSASLER